MSDLNSAFLTTAQLAEIGFASVGTQVLVHPTCVIVGASRISIGDHVRIDPHTMIMTSDSEIRIGRHVHIASGVLLSGSCGITVEDFVGLSHGVKVFSRSDDFSGEHLTGPTIPGQFVSAEEGAVVIGRHAVIGAGSIVMPGVTVGTGAILGSLSLAKDSLAEWGIFAGVPARFLKERSKALLEDERRLAALESNALRPPAEPHP